MQPMYRGILFIAVAALLAAAVLAALFFAFVAEPDRSRTFLFTCWLSVGQVLLLALSLIYAAARDGREGSLVPVNSAVVIATAGYNFVAVLTILIFTKALLPEHVSPLVYYTVTIGEFVLLLAILSLLQVVGTAHQSGHSTAVESRATVTRAASQYARVASLAAASGWELRSRGLPDKLRFSESVRADANTAAAVLLRLERLEAVTSERPSDETKVEVDRLIAEIEALASHGA